MKIISIIIVILGLIVINSCEKYNVSEYDENGKYALGVAPDVNFVTASRYYPISSYNNPKILETSSIQENDTFKFVLLNPDQYITEWNYPSNTKSFYLYEDGILNNTIEILNIDGYDQNGYDQYGNSYNGYDQNGNYDVKFSELSEAKQLLWDFGDGSTSEKRHPYHIYTTKGVYNVKLTASNDYGSKSITKPYEVGDYNPESDFIADSTTLSYNNTVQQGDYIHFKLKDVNNVYNYRINYGDGYISNLQTYYNDAVSYNSHQYDSIGIYDISLILYSNSIYSKDSIIITKENYITVIDGKPIINFEADKTTVLPNEDINFTGNIRSAVGHDIYWDFGDGYTASYSTPSHHYYTTGIYTVKLKATNIYGVDSIIKQDYITVTVNCPSTVTDIDGNTYNVVEIGNQCWMQENLKVTHYHNGTEIPNVTGNTNWANLEDNNTDKAYCWYNDDISNKNIYGALYTFSAATNGQVTTGNEITQGVCPEGWHVPNINESSDLTSYLGNSDIAGGKMKEAGTVHWKTPNEGADNSSGFTALPGGRRDYNTGISENKTYNFNFWRSAEYYSSQAYSNKLNYDDDNLDFQKNYKSNGYSVRCIRD